MIIGKINMAKVDVDKYFKTQKGEFLDICLIDTPDDKYGNDFMIVQSVTKEQRDAGERGAILGNAKNLGTSPRAAAKSKPAPKDESGEW